MSIKANLYYNISRDEIVGFEDNGENKTLKPASSATVFMVRGLKANWKQAIAYLFSQTNYSAQDMLFLINKIVKWLSFIGLDVVCLITDMGSNCIELSKVLGVTSENTKIVVGEKEMFFYFDPPHLIKALRNNLIQCELRWDAQKASWRDIESFYESDIKRNNRLAPKLTKCHIQPTSFEKMRVKFATQIISSTVAASLETYVSLGALPLEAMGTAYLLDKFDKCFDIFNSSTFDTPKLHSKPFQGNSMQNEFLSEMIYFLSKLAVYNRSTGKRVNVKFIKCWTISIKSLIHLWPNLEQKGFKFILTRRLNQDCVENYFGYIRKQHGNTVNPTPIQFSRGFKKSFITAYIHTADMNCIEDFDTVVTEISDFSSSNSSPFLIQSDIISSENKISMKLDNCDYYHLSLPEQNAFKYVCGYLISKCLKIHLCDTCTQFSQQNEKLDNTNLFIHYKAYKSNETQPFGSLKTPHGSFYAFIYQLEQIFFNNIEEHLLDNPGKNMFALFKKVEYKHPCPNFPFIYLVKLYTRLRIYYLLKHSNSDFRNTSKNKYFNELVKYNKCRIV